MQGGYMLRGRLSLIPNPDPRYPLWSWPRGCMWTPRMPGLLTNPIRCCYRYRCCSCHCYLCRFHYRFPYCYLYRLQRVLLSAEAQTKAKANAGTDPPPPLLD